jgi:hypothetical protein
MTVFIRLLEASVDEKAGELRAALDALRREEAPANNPHRVVFERSPTQFSDVPGSPFAYWVSEAVRSIFGRLDPFQSEGRSAAVGLQTSDDFRFVRAGWEVAPASMNKRWFPFAKGGEFSPYYADVFLCVNWSTGPQELWSIMNPNIGKPRSNIWMLPETIRTYFFRPGLTWPRRTQSGFGIRVMPAGCIFADKGPAAFVEDDSPEQLLALLAITTSAAFCYLVELQMAFGSYEVGVIQRTPVPELSSTETHALAGFAHRAWSLKRSLDTTNEMSHAFLLPTGLNERITGLDGAAVESELAQIQQQIDDRVFELYGIGPEDRAVIESSTRTMADSEDGAEEGTDEENEEEVEAADAGQTAAIVSWLVGVAFGRFDPRLATDERAVPPEPEPFDPLPPRSPGMWPEGQVPKDAPDLLVDDEGHPSDLAARVKQAAEQVHWQSPDDVRPWLAREFFPLHIKMYSKSRRKAPIYWQLATPSGSYSVWLYFHAFTKDSLFRVQHDYAGPKLLHEEQRLESLRREFGDSPARTERQRIADQESFVEELRAFLEEIKRAAPLWNPNLDDGVIINFAPLWRLVTHCKSWQKELKSTWDGLCAEEYEWAHLVMHLWPERVIPKCAKDRSLAIAHGLEEVFWVENKEGKWVARENPTRSIEEIVRERTSPAVRAALDGLLQAPVAQNGGVRSRNRRTRATRSA